MTLLHVFLLIVMFLLAATYTFIIKTKDLKHELKKQQTLSLQRMIALTNRLEYLENKCKEYFETMTSHPSQNQKKSIYSIINLGSLHIAAESISYITTQAAESPEHGSPRIKVIHYVDDRFPDTVYCSFPEILQQMGDDFMLINKNQIVNLRMIRRLQGSEFHLKNVNAPFIVSKQNLEEFNKRVDAIMQSM